MRTARVHSLTQSSYRNSGHFIRRLLVIGDLRLAPLEVWCTMLINPRCFMQWSTEGQILAEG